MKFSDIPKTVTQATTKSEPKYTPLGKVANGVTLVIPVATGLITRTTKNRKGVDQTLRFVKTNDDKEYLVSERTARELAAGLNYCKEQKATTLEVKIGHAKLGKGLRVVLE